MDDFETQGLQTSPTKMEIAWRSLAHNLGADLKSERFKNGELTRNLENAEKAVGDLSVWQEICDDQKEQISYLSARMSEMLAEPSGEQIPLVACGLAWAESMRASGQPGSQTLPRTHIDGDGVHWAVTQDDNIILVTADRNNFETQTARVEVRREQEKLADLVNRRRAHQSNMDSHVRVANPQDVHKRAMEEIEKVLNALDVDIETKKQDIANLRAKADAQVIDRYEFPKSGGFELRFS